MKIKIKSDAKVAYYKNASPFQLNAGWAETLDKISGMVLDVETDYLFADQFNTGPVPGISENGFRIMMYSVAEVIDDIRPQSMRCNWCGKCNLVAPLCPICHKSEYLERFQGRFFPVPGRHENKLENYRKIAGLKLIKGAPTYYLGNRGMGCHGDSWDNPSHVFSIAMGPKRRGDYAGYMSVDSFLGDKGIPGEIKRNARLMMEAWAKEMGY